MSGDPELSYFADGMEIITALSRTRWLFVTARNSSFTSKGRAVDVRQVGGELGVRYVLEGSIREAGNRVRITCQLIDAITGAHLWADHFDGSKIYARGHYRKSVAADSVGRLRFKLVSTDRNGYIPIRRLFYLKVHLFLRCRILHGRRQ